ncbi:conserved hypothetical protein [Neospora caninum Liverpool]|uniref:Transmembrane protein n=1 Tax=Neospora caninum (strain Liverpool) TaxID=572307 RepID=F0V915_NEOCL|nr:conserved hypothetical protein [Neospora caninum Liverpool]CBZ50206.1 conserved hypothetical protein [Neospora caninum Liverpool]CEL64807.1 TPA: hypothetical protein BN1204_006810 [Neospora caninum Liverpool]|eukprot:XP_003880241.1 conserved hypothetical protein [Neospora caninum Liverpool]
MAEFQKTHRLSRRSVTVQRRLRFWAIFLVCAVVTGCDDAASASSSSNSTAELLTGDAVPLSTDEGVNPSEDVWGVRGSGSQNASQAEEGNGHSRDKQLGGSDRDSLDVATNKGSDLSSSSELSGGSRGNQDDGDLSSSNTPDAAGSVVDVHPENAVPTKEAEAVSKARETTVTKRHRLRGLAVGVYPWGATAAAYGAYLNWYRTAYLPWYYTTFGVAAAAPILTSPAVYAAYYPTVAAPVANVPVQAALPVVQQTAVPVGQVGVLPVAQQGPVNAVQPAVAVTQRLAAPVVQQSAVPVVAAGAASVVPVALPQGNRVAGTAPTEALLSLEEPVNENQQQTVAPVALLTAPSAIDYGNGRGSRTASRSSDGVGGLGLSNFAAFLARPDGTLAAIGGNGT